MLYRGQPIQKLRFGALRARAGLPADVTAYSIRETMARELRARAVPHDQIELLLGHRLPDGHSGTSARYAPYAPDYCRQAADTIDTIMAEVQALAQRARITGPSTPAGALAPKLRPSRLGEGALSA